MKGKTKRRKHVDQKMRDRLAKNVTSRMEKKFSMSSNKHQDLADKAGLWLSRVQDVTNAATGTSIDTIALLAKALGCTPAELLSDAAEDDTEIRRLWSTTDDLGQSNVLQTARQWAQARPKGKTNNS